MTQNNRDRNAPLLKWPGGKRALVDDLLAILPLSFKQYYEPFLGGGALFFALSPSRSVLADSNLELINCYQQVRDRPETVITHLAGLKNTESEYYAVRSSLPSDEAARAARLIYLMTLSFNGIHRVNVRGEFNVPYGYKTHLVVCDPVRIYATSAALSSSRLLCGDFETSLSGAEKGDLVYLDPPYTVAHGDNGFVKYNSKIFSWGDQLRLAKVASELDQRGCHVVISNADHPSIESLYGNFKVQRISRASVIAASAGHRGTITECIYYNSKE